MTNHTNGLMSQTSKIEELYDVKEELGRGQFAVVKRCVSRKDGDEFAAKFIKLKRTKVSRVGLSRDEVQKEASILKCIDHKNVIKLHNVFDLGNEMVLIMELLNGGELFDKICEDEFLTEIDACRYLKQVLQAIHFLHRMKIVHLDIKPENIVLKWAGSSAIKLVDFGLSQRLVDGQQFKEMMGTPEFVAPEIINYEDIKSYTDMWAIGVLTYVLLSGYSPFLGENNQETFENILKVNYDFEGDKFNGICEQAKDFVARLLVKNPNKRNSAADCLENEWLVRMTHPRERMISKTVINTAGFKSFVARRRWKGTFHKLTAISRFAKPVRERDESDDGSNNSSKNGSFEEKASDVNTTKPISPTINKIRSTSFENGLKPSSKQAKLEVKEAVQESAKEQPTTHVTKIDITLHKPLEAEIEANCEKTEVVQDDDPKANYIHFDTDAEKVDPPEEDPIVETNIHNNDVITYEESSYIHADESCVEIVDIAVEAKPYFLEPVDEVLNESDMYVVDAVTSISDEPETEVPPVQQEVVEAVVVSDSHTVHEVPNIIKEEETPIENEAQPDDVIVFDDSSVDISELGTSETTASGVEKDRADLLKEQLFSLISDFDYSDTHKTSMTSSDDSDIDDDDVKTNNDVNSTPSLNDDGLVHIELPNNNKANTESTEPVAASDNSLGNNRLSSELCQESDNTNPIHNNEVKEPSEYSLPQINIVYNNSLHTEASEENNINSSEKTVRKYSREVPVRYTESIEEEDINKRKNEADDEEDSELLSTNISFDNQTLDASLVSSDLNLSPSGIDGRNMSESSEISESVTAATAPVENGSPKPFDLLKDASAILNNTKVRDSKSDDMLSSTSSTRSKRLSERESLSEQRRKFILGEPRPASLDSSLMLSEESTTNVEDAVFDNTKSVDFDVQESPEDIVAMLETMAINAGMKIPKDNTINTNQNGTLKSGKVEDNPGPDVEDQPTLDINENPENAVVSKEKEAEVARNGEPEVTKKMKKKKVKQNTCKCDLM